MNASANYTTNEIGTHTELFSAVGLIANNYKVAKPYTTEVYDYVILDPRDNKWKKAQVKTGYWRNDRNAIIVFAKKRNAEPYRVDEVDVFLTVFEDKVYIFDNEGKTEYWVTRSNISEKWTELPHSLKRGGSDD